MTKPQKHNTPCGTVAHTHISYQIGFSVFIYFYTFFSYFARVALTIRIGSFVTAYVVRFVSFFLARYFPVLWIIFSSMSNTRTHNLYAYILINKLCNGIYNYEKNRSLEKYMKQKLHVACLKLFEWKRAKIVFIVVFGNHSDFLQNSDIFFFIWRWKFDMRF